MSQIYRAVQWNRHKKVYDLILAATVLLAIATFASVGAVLFPSLTAETLAIRAVGTTAFVLLHVILCIGPLCRLDPRFLPLLYNRRHLGVTMACLALVHGALSVFQFHALGDLNPFVSVLVSDLTFQPFGLAALLILLVMAATSHDFWLANLTAPMWKAIHMSVYAAYGLLVAHVAFGVLQTETSTLYPIALGLGMATVGGLHLAAGLRESRRDVPPRGRTLDTASRSDFVYACNVDAIEESRARIVTVAGERVAIFRYGGRLSAISNVCQHQNGPLGEGRIRDGCVVCPWHGYQYDPASGRAPTPFAERVPTFDLLLEGGKIFVHTRPNPPGTFVEPLTIPNASSEADTTEPPSLGHFLGQRVAALLLSLMALVAGLAANQGGFLPSLFEFGHEREFVGFLSEKPVPALVLIRPGDTAHCGATSTYPLVDQGKHGAVKAIAGLDGRHVRLRGTLIHLDGNTWIELANDDIHPIGEPDAPSDSAREATVESLGMHRLEGEIVDSKCHYGVMNPGSGEVHRACAVRCISGGIPPSFLIRDGDGRRATLLLVDRSGRGISREVLTWVGRPVSIEGEVVRHRDLLVLEIDPAAIRAVESGS